MNHRSKLIGAAAVLTAAVLLACVFVPVSAHRSDARDIAVYTGRATVNHYNYGLTVTVTMDDDYIQSITAEHDTNGYSSSNNTYWNWAVNGRYVGGVFRPSPLQQIVDTQSTQNIDVVTGATYTSNALIQAVNNALATIPTPTPVPTPAPTPTPAPVPGTPGDVNGDGSVSVDDALLVLRASLTLVQLSAEQAEAADINNDGIVDMTDALVILRIAMGLIG